jgi:hypothetical protein
MPDLVRVNAHTCSSNVKWRREVQGSQLYVVWWKFQFEGPSAGMYDYECTCPAFKYRHKRGAQYCKHIEAVKHERCGWNAELDPGAQPIQGVRPVFESKPTSLFSDENEVTEATHTVKDVPCLVCPQCQQPVEVVLTAV